MSFPTVNKPVMSPHLNEYDLPTELDPTSGFLVPLLGVVLPDSNGNTNLPTGAGVVVVQPASQVTGKRQLPLVGTSQIPCVGLIGVDPTTGAPVPFVPGSAVKVTGKFQSTVLTGTGGSQTVAHGLGVVPSLVLAAVYDTNGIALPHVITEGVHTTTNLLVTVTSGVKFKIVAFA